MLSAPNRNNKRSHSNKFLNKLTMNIHILGICGTLMGSIACLAKELGHVVSGTDQNIYPPMSNQLQNLGIALDQGYKTTSIPSILIWWLLAMQISPEGIQHSNLCSKTEFRSCLELNGFIGLFFMIGG